MSKELKITDGIDANVWSAFVKVCESSNVKGYTALNEFMLKVIYASIDHLHLDHFKTYIDFIPNLYFKTFNNEVGKSTYTKIQQHSVAISSLYLKEIIQLVTFRARSKNNKPDINRINQFYYAGFSAYGRLLFYMIHHGDVKHFLEAIDHLESLDDQNTGKLFALKDKIREYKQKPVADQDKRVLDKLQKDYSALYQFQTYKRHVISGTKYWLYYSYRLGKINSPTLITLLDKISIAFRDWTELLRDLLFFREYRMQGYLNWNSWTMFQDKSGETHMISSSEWLTFGFLAEIIRENNSFINSAGLTTEQLQQLAAAYQSLIDEGVYFRNYWEKWKDVLNTDSQNNLVERVNNIIEIFKEGKRKNSINTYQEIANTDLDDLRLTTFKTHVGNSWKNAAHITKLFKSRNNTVDRTEDDENLYKIGSKIILEGGKSAFIQAPQYREIFNMSDMGGKVGRWEDDYFFREIITSDPKQIKGGSLVKVLVRAIETLKEVDVQPDLILLSPQYSYKDEVFLKDERFISKMKELGVPEDVSNFYLGKFDNIPIYSSFSEQLRGKVVVCNFSQAFNMEFKTNQNWYEDLLEISVTPITLADAQLRLDVEPVRWKKTGDGSTLTDDEALAYIRTSILIDIWTILKFNVLNENAYIVGEINLNAREDLR